jgi:hypothetical protein
MLQRIKQLAKRASNFQLQQDSSSNTSTNPEQSLSSTPASSPSTDHVSKRSSKKDLLSTFPNTTVDLTNSTVDLKNDIAASPTPVSAEPICKSEIEAQDADTSVSNTLKGADQASIKDAKVEDLERSLGAQSTAASNQCLMPSAPSLDQNQPAPISSSPTSTTFGKSFSSMVDEKDEPLILEPLSGSKSILAKRSLKTKSILKTASPTTARAPPPDGLARKKTSFQVSSSLNAITNKSVNRSPIGFHQEDEEEEEKLLPLDSLPRKTMTLRTRSTTKQPSNHLFSTITNPSSTSESDLPSSSSTSIRPRTTIKRSSATAKFSNTQANPHTLSRSQTTKSSQQQQHQQSNVTFIKNDRDLILAILNGMEIVLPPVEPAAQKASKGLDGRTTLRGRKTVQRSGGTLKIPGSKTVKRRDRSPIGELKLVDEDEEMPTFGRSDDTNEAVVPNVVVAEGSPKEQYDIPETSNQSFSSTPTMTITPVDSDHDEKMHFNNFKEDEDDFIDADFEDAEESAEWLDTLDDSITHNNNLRRKTTRRTPGGGLLSRGRATTIKRNTTRYLSPPSSSRSPSPSTRKDTPSLLGRKTTRFAAAMEDICEISPIDENKNQYSSAENPYLKVPSSSRGSIKRRTTTIRKPALTRNIMDFQELSEEEEEFVFASEGGSGLSEGGLQSRATTLVKGRTLKTVKRGAATVLSRAMTRSLYIHADEVVREDVCSFINFICVSARWVPKY